LFGIFSWSNQIFGGLSETTGDTGRSAIVFWGEPFQPFACQGNFSGKQGEKRQNAGLNIYSIKEFSNDSSPSSIAHLNDISARPA
jgi:hypothetical protein